MKRTRTIFLAFTAIMLVWGCEKYIEFDAEVKQPKLVVNSLFAPDSTWQVHISNSLSVIDEAQLSNIENATVLIKNESGTLVEALVHDADGYYFGALTPNVNTNYTVEVSAPNYETVWAQNSIPSPVSITAVDTLTEFDIDGYERKRLTVHFSDPIVSNYYQLRLRTIDTSSGQSFSDYIWMELPEGDFDNGQAGDTYSSYGLFRDQLFNGETHSVSVLIDAWYFEQGIPLEVVLNTTSEALYNYRLSYERYLNADGNPFAQPVQVYSNVEQGFGLFAGFSRDGWMIDP